MRLESGPLGAGAEEVGFAAVALAADESDGLQSGRRRAVIAVAVVAGGGREVLLLEERGGVHAARPALVLVHRQRPAVGEGVACHALGIGVAAAAGLGHVRRVDGRARVGRAEDAVDAVAVDAGGDVLVPRSQQGAVPARPVLVLLVDPGVRAEALHVVGTEWQRPQNAGMAARSGAPR